jgi:hypothetical protein
MAQGETKKNKEGRGRGKKYSKVSRERLEKGETKKENKGKVKRQTVKDGRG